MTVKIRRFKGRYKANMLASWKLTDVDGPFAKSSEKVAREAVAFTLNECVKDDVGGLSIYMSHPYDKGRLRNLGVDAIRFKIGLTGGSIEEPYFEVTITDLVRGYIGSVEGGFPDGREELKKKLLILVKEIEESQSG